MGDLNLALSAHIAIDSSPKILTSSLSFQCRRAGKFIQINKLIAN